MVNKQSWVLREIHLCVAKSWNRMIPSNLPGKWHFGVSSSAWKAHLIKVKTLSSRVLREMQEIHKCRILPPFWPPDPGETGKTSLCWKCCISQWIPSFPFPIPRNLFFPHFCLFVCVFRCFVWGVLFICSFGLFVVFFWLLLFFVFHGCYPWACWLWNNTQFRFQLSPSFSHFIDFFPQTSGKSGNWLWANPGGANPSCQFKERSLIPFISWFWGKLS